jgi:hypothetical protein
VLPLLFKKMVASVNGAPVTLGHADAWAASPEVVGTLLPRLRELLETWREDGIAWAQCPACRQWEAELTMPGLVTALAAGMPPLFDEPFLAIPSLAQPLRRGWRPTGLLLTSRLRAALPSACHALDAPFHETTLADIEPGEALGTPAGAAPLLPGPRETMAWARWAPDDTPRRPGFEHWRRELPAFHAVLRLALAVDPVGVGDPELVERLPAIDFYYLDALYWLTHAVDVRDPLRAAVRCEVCSATFLPVR